MDFTYESYKSLIGSLRENHYDICDYFHYMDVDRPAILRHDIDNDIGKALKMAEIEYELGVSSTYYVLLSSDFYNVCSKKNVDKLHEIQRLGHTIGLHYDEVRYGEGADVPGTIEQEIRILEAILGTSVRSVSMHRPSRRTLDADYVIRGGKVVNSYGRVFFRDFKYVSDSRRHWRENVRQIIASGQYQRLHILTHPIWYSQEGKSAKEVLKDFCHQKVGECYESLIDDITDLHEFLTPEEL